MKKLCLLLLLVLFTALGVSPASALTPEKALQYKTIEQKILAERKSEVNKEILVKYKDKQFIGKKFNASISLALQGRSKISSNLEILRANAKSDIPGLLKQLKQDPAIEIVEENRISSLFSDTPEPKTMNSDFGNNSTDSVLDLLKDNRTRQTEEVRLEVDQSAFEIQAALKNKLSTTKKSLLSYTDIWEQEPNNTFNSANQIFLDTDIWGDFYSKYDLDHYQLNVSQSGRIALLGFAGDYGAYFALGLYDSNDNCLGWTLPYTDPMDGYNFQYLEANVTPGTYYIAAMTWNAYTGDNTSLMEGRAYLFEAFMLDNVPVSSVSLDKTSLTLVKGEKKRLNPTIYPEDASNKSVTWSSSRPTVATVNSDGVVTGIKTGTATITVTTVDGDRKAYCSVTVEAPPVVTNPSAVNDPLYLYQWGLEAVKAPEAWQSTNSIQKPIVVAVIDSGIEPAHDDLINRIAPGGYNFVTNSSNVYDLNGHGTAVSGVIGAQTNNYFGIAGVAGKFNIKILPLQVAYHDGSIPTDLVVSAINYAITQDVDVINLSLGSSVPSVLEEQAIQDAVNHGIVVVASAGNDGNTVYNYPASYDNVISVGSITSDLGLSIFSNRNDKVDLVGPGELVYTTNLENTYGYKDGTSFSAPLVSGIAALCKGINPDLTPEQILNILTATAQDKGQTGKDNYYGYGLVDALAAANDAYESIVIPVTGVTLNKTTLSLPERTNETLTANVLPANATYKSLNWSSSATSIATVDNNGKVTAINPGTAIISAVSAADPTKKATCQVTVTPNLSGAQVSVNVYTQTQNVPFAFRITEAKGVNGANLNGSKYVKITSSNTAEGLSGVLYNSELNFTNGSTAIDLTLQKTGSQTLTVQITGVTDAITSSLTVIAPTKLLGTAVNSTGDIITLVFNKPLANEDSVHTQFAVTVNEEVYATTGAVINSNSMELTLEHAVYGNALINVSYTPGTIVSTDGGILRAFSTLIPVLIISPEVSVNPINKNLSITAETPDTAINVPIDVTDATIKLSSMLEEPIDGIISTKVLPSINIEADTTMHENPVQVTLPAGLIIQTSSENDWDGTINLPTVKANSSVTVTPDAGKKATVSTVIEVGFDDIPLTFNKAVRILLPGQGDKEVGFFRGNNFYRITTNLTIDSQEIDDVIPANGEGKIKVGSDMVIWTKHFTKFVSYSQVKSGGGGGGGGGAAPVAVVLPTITPEYLSPTKIEAGITVAAGGKIEAFDSSVILEIPAYAVDSDIQIIIEQKTENEIPGKFQPQNSGYKLGSNVYEFSSSGQETFNKQISVALKFDQNKVSPDKASVYWLNEATGNWQYVGGTVNNTNNTISFTTNHFSKYAVLAKSSNFLDVVNHWARQDIEEMVGLGIIKGVSENQFKPDATITRAEFATLLVRCLNLKAVINKNQFTDVHINEWYYEPIMIANEHELVKGSGGLFRPNAKITREEIAIMLVRALEKAGFKPAEVDASKILSIFADSKQVSAWARDSIAKTVNLGIVNGRDGNKIAPLHNATRAEGAVLVKRLLAQIKK